MFEQYAYIPKQHHVSLASTIRNHSVSSVATAPLLAKMYRYALDGLAGPVEMKELGFATSLFVTADGIKVSSVTATQSGLWIQLARVGDKPPLLTLGQKWIMESGNATLGNTATSLW